HFDELRSISEFAITASSANFCVYSRDNRGTEAKFKGNIDESAHGGRRASITHIHGASLASSTHHDYQVVDGQRSVSGPANSVLKDFKFIYSGNGNESIERASPLTTKSMTISVDDSLDAADAAKVTHIYGFELADPIKLKYTTGSGSS